MFFCILKARRCNKGVLKFNHFVNFFSLWAVEGIKFAKKKNHQFQTQETYNTFFFVTDTSLRAVIIIFLGVL